MQIVIAAVRLVGGAVRSIDMPVFMPVVYSRRSDITDNLFFFQLDCQILRRICIDEIGKITPVKLHFVPKSFAFHQIAGLIFVEVLLLLFNNMKCEKPDVK